MIQMSKDGTINNIAFLKKSMYEVYSKIGIKCSYILENLILSKTDKKEKIQNGLFNIGIYPFNYTWDKNIYNQLSVGKFIDNSNINYNPLDSKMEEFLNTMKIKSTKDPIEIMNIKLENEPIKTINIQEISDIISKNDINIACDFTDYVHAMYFISLENEILCIIGNNSNLFDKKLAVNSEDNPIVISKQIECSLENKNDILKEYKNWKKDYNEISIKSVREFIEK